MQYILTQEEYDDLVSKWRLEEAEAKLALVLKVLKENNSKPESEQFVCQQGWGVCGDCRLASLNHHLGPICSQEEYED